MRPARRRHRNNGLRKVCGCPRRTWPKCPHAWYFNYRPRGGPDFRFSLDKHCGRHIASKTEADAIAADLRQQIREGTFGKPTPRADMTLHQLAAIYLDRYVTTRHADTHRDFESRVRTICNTPVPTPDGQAIPFGEWRVSDIVTDSIERFREARRAAGAGLGGTNRVLSALRALFNWALKVGYVEATPFRRAGVPVVSLLREIPRSRRLQDGEEAALLAAASPHLRDIIIAALETGMRRGEILGLRWHQIEGMHVDGSHVTWGPRPTIHLKAEDTKTRRSRRIPISSRLRAVLEIRRYDPAGHPLPLDAYVFGDAIGQRVTTVKRAWMTAVLRAHGHAPHYTHTANLSRASREALAAIDLHFHDLRREAGSRWIEGGVPIHVVRDWLGHTSIAQTSTYLSGTMTTQHDAMTAFDARRANLQNFATRSGTGGSERPQPDMTPLKKPRKNAVGREPALM
jgi:integrase